MQLLVLLNPVFLSAMGNCHYSAATAFRMSGVTRIGLISIMEADFFLKNNMLNKGFVFITSEDCLEMLL